MCRGRSWSSVLWSSIQPILSTTWREALRNGRRFLPALKCSNNFSLRNMELRSIWECLVYRIRPECDQPFHSNLQTMMWPTLALDSLRLATVLFPLCPPVTVWIMNPELCLNHNLCGEPTTTCRFGRQPVVHAFSTALHRLRPMPRHRESEMRFAI